MNLDVRTLVAVLVGYLMATHAVAVLIVVLLLAMAPTVLLQAARILASYRLWAAQQVGVQPVRARVAG